MNSATHTVVTRQKRGRTSKIILGILLAVLIVGGCAWLYWETNKKRIVKEKIVDAIVERIAGLYAVNYDDINMDELAGNVSLVNLKVGYNRKQYDSLKNAGKLPSVLMQADIPMIGISGIKTKKALWGKQLIGRKLVISRPTIYIYYTGEGEGAKKNIPGNEVYRQVLGDMELIQVDSVEINDARIVTLNMKHNRDSVVMDHVNASLGNLAIDSSHQGDQSRILFSDKMKFSSEAISWRARSGKYHYKLAGLVMNSDDRTIHIRQLNIIPFAGEAAFVKSQPYQTDRLDMHFNNILLSGVDFSKVMDESLVAEKMVTGSTTIKAYRDLRIPHDSKNRSGTYPHQQIDIIPIPVVIKQANFPATNIEYTEVNDISGKPGIVGFRNGTIGIQNFTNDRSALSRNNLCHVNINVSLLGLIPIKATMDLPLGDPSGKFHVEGNGYGDLDARALNKLSEPMGMARIRSGRVNTLEFKLDGDNTHAEGLVTVLYNDLKIDFLEIDEDKAGNIDKKDFTSLVANIFIKDANPLPNEKPRTVAVNHARDMNRSFYNLIWKTIFEGINLTMGNKKKMKRP